MRLLKDIPLQSQSWQLTTGAPVQCPELGVELQDLQRGETFRHIRADTEESKALENISLYTFIQKQTAALIAKVCL